jgi:hypothetical protein
MGYRLTIYGHLDVWKIPPDGSLGTEPTIRQVYNVEAGNLRDVNKFLDERLADIVGANAMKVYKDPDKRELTKIEPWIVVPMHMITHLSFSVRQLTGEVPIYNSTKGIVEVPSGKEVIKQ